MRAVGVRVAFCAHRATVTRIDSRVSGPLNGRMDFVRIDRTALPPDEQAAADSIERNLIHLQMAAERFRHTVDLYLFAHERKLAGQDDMQKMIAWIDIAGRNGAILAYDIHMVTQAINSVNAPALRNKIDMDERRLATKLFTDEFRTIAGIRTSAAHPGELSAREGEIDKHRLRKDINSELGSFAAGTYISGGTSANADSLIYSASFRGNSVQYELSMRKADVLETVAQHYCRAFYLLEDAISAAQRERR